MNSLSGFSTSAITFLNAASITPGSFLNFYNSDNDPYYIWYKVNGVGSDPIPPGTVRGLMVSLNGTETDSIVARDTQFIVNASSWSSPDCRGVFLRGWQSNNPYPADPDANSRTSGWESAAGNKIGSYQGTQTLNHTHNSALGALISPTDTFPHAQSGGSYYWSFNIAAQETSDILNSSSSTGTYNQSNPLNIYVNYVIKI